MTNREKIIKVINDQQTLNVFANLYSRWQDERKFESFDEYVKVMAEKVSEICGSISDLKGSKAPFGLHFSMGGQKFYIFLKRKGQSVCFCAKQEA